jgi:hypothetical protein
MCNPATDLNNNNNKTVFDQLQPFSYHFLLLSRLLYDYFIQLI